MSLIGGVLNPVSRKASGNPFDPRYWPSEEGSRQSATGVHVNPDVALAVRAVYRCVSLLSGVVGYLPLFIYKRLERGKERAPNHPLSRLFQLGPNRWQTAEQWFRLVVAHLELRGNSYHKVIPGPRGIVDQLIPLHPARVCPEVNNDDGQGWVDARTATLDAGGEMRYVVTNRNGARTMLTEDEVFHIRGLSSNGVLGMSRISLMSESVGLSLAMENYAAKFFSQNAVPRGVLHTDQKLEKEAHTRLVAWLEKQVAGLANAHRTPILEQGMEWQAIGLSNRDTQFLEGRQYQSGEIAGWFGVPPHLIGDVDKSTSWGSGLSEQNLAMLIYTIAPILESIEQAIDKELIVADQTYFAEFLVDAFLRMDPKAREEAINIAIMNSTLSPNEGRELNNRNPRPGGDAFLMPLNMQAVGSPLPLDKRVEAVGALIRAGFEPDDATDAVGLPKLAHLGLAPVTVQSPKKEPPALAPGEPPPGGPPPDETPDERESRTGAPDKEKLTEGKEPRPPREGRDVLRARRAAAHVIRKETAWVRTWAPRLAGDPEAWAEKLSAFYERHAAMVVDWLGVSPREAATYCSQQREALLASGVAIAETWEPSRVDALLALALEEGEAA